jgi:hypothetical protein
VQGEQRNLHEGIQFEFAPLTGEATAMEPPIACTLKATELQERRSTILNGFRDAALEVTSIPGGHAFRFEPTSEVLTRLFQLVDLERQCCPFLTFRLTIEAGNQTISLEITGPEQAQTIIADFFG